MILYWFDTNCFSSLIDGTFHPGTRDEVFQKVLNKEAYLIISPFTFYEILKGRNGLEEIKAQYDRMMALPPFYIANIFNIFEIKEGLADGQKYITNMKMGEVCGETPIEYAWFRDGFSEMIGAPYANYFIQYSKMASIIYLIALECDKKGHINQRTMNKISFIEQFDKRGHNKKSFENIFSDFFIGYDHRSIHPEEDLGKKGMQMLILEFADIFLNAAESKQQLIEEGAPYSSNTFNERLIINESLFRLTREQYQKVLKEMTFKTGNALSVRKVFNNYIKDKIKEPFLREAFEDLICRKNVLYENINNDFIDLLNIFFAATFFRGHENYYFTDDGPWVNFLNKRKQKDLFSGVVLFCRHSPNIKLN